MIWLQRDFGLYIVGLFDTERAAVALRYPGRGLAFLLAKFVNVQAQKQHQLADWRIRPLSKDLFDYARSDTHFLLYIYDCMRNELVENSNFSDPEQDLLQQVLDGSKAYQLQRYENPIYDAVRGMGATGWYKQLFKTPALLSKEQFSVFKALHQWRDNVARQEDDSIHYVMSNHALLSIAREMPTSREKLLAATQSQTSAMRQRNAEILAVIAKAKEEGAHGREMRDVLKELDQYADQMLADRKADRLLKNPSKLVPTSINPPIPTINATIPVSTKSNSPSPGTRPAVLDAIAARSETSNFWGSALGSPAQKRPLSTDVRLNIPLPELTASIFAEPSAQTQASDSTAGAKNGSGTQHAFVRADDRPAPKSDDVFVIRELGGRKDKKRKAEDAALENEENIPSADPVASGADHFSINLDDGDEEQTVRRAAKERKRQAKAEKKAAKAAADAAAMNGDGEEEEEAFDYANAPSVLHANDSKESREKRKKKGKPDRGIDPYKKALDAPKGLPRVHREKAGRSATFKE